MEPLTTAIVAAVASFIAAAITSLLKTFVHRKSEPKIKVKTEDSSDGGVTIHVSYEGDDSPSQEELERIIKAAIDRESQPEPNKRLDTNA